MEDENEWTENERRFNEIANVSLEHLTDAQVNGNWSHSSNTESENETVEKKLSAIDSYYQFIGQEEIERVTYYKYKCLLCNDRVLV